jgi:hypothetical protein
MFSPRGPGTSFIFMGNRQALAAVAQEAVPEPDSRQLAVVPQLEELTYRVEWWRLTDGGAWLVRVLDPSGEVLDMATADSPTDALLAVAERLLPPGSL